MSQQLLAAIAAGDAGRVEHALTTVAPERVGDRELAAALRSRNERIIAAVTQHQRRQDVAPAASNEQRVATGVRNALELVNTNRVVYDALSVRTRPLDSYADARDFYGDVDLSTGRYAIADYVEFVRARLDLGSSDVRARLDACADFYDETRPLRADARGLFPVAAKGAMTRDVALAWTLATPARAALRGAGPVFVLLHDVPANRYHMLPLQRRLAHFGRVLAIDLLGAGESSKPLGLPDELYDWHFDADAVHALVTERFGGERVVVVAAGAAAAVALHFAARYADTLAALVLLEPVAFNDTPTSPLRTLGRDVHAAWRRALDAATLQRRRGAVEAALASASFRDAVVTLGVPALERALAALADDDDGATPSSDLLRPYADVEYARTALYDRATGQRIGGSDAAPPSMAHNVHALAALAVRASRASPAQVMPLTADAPRGVDFVAIRAPVTIMSSSSAKSELFALALQNSLYVHTHALAPRGDATVVAGEIVKFSAQVLGYGERPLRGLLRRLAATDDDAVRAPGLAQFYMGFRAHGRDGAEHSTKAIADAFLGCTHDDAHTLSCVL